MSKIYINKYQLKNWLKYFENLIRILHFNNPKFKKIRWPLKIFDKIVKFMENSLINWEMLHKLWIFYSEKYKLNLKNYAIIKKI